MQRPSEASDPRSQVAPEPCARRAAGPTGSARARASFPLSPEELLLLQEAGALPDSAERMLVHALIQSDRLLDAHKALERLATAGQMPHWAVAFAAQIALRRNDPKTGAAHLEELFSRGVTTA